MYKMISIRQFTNLLIIGLCISIISCAEKDVETQAENILEDLNIDSSAPVDSILNNVGNYFKIPGLAASVASQEKVLESGVHGTIDVRTNEPLTMDKIFDINSISKSFTTLILMQLVEEGALNLEDKITTIIPDLSPGIHEDYENARVIDFIKHQSGLAEDKYYFNKEDKPVLRGKLGDKRYQYTNWILSQEASKTVGEFNYSNSGYIVLGSIIEEITCKVYENNVLERIYFPLGLYSSGFGWPVDYKVEYTYGHMWVEGEVTPVKFNREVLLRVENPSGGIHLSPRDLMTYTREHMLGLGGSSLLLSKEGFQQMHDIQGSTGLGWYSSVFENYSGTEIGGVGDGYMTEVFISDTDDIGIVVLANLNDENTWIACKAIELALLKKYATATK
jgi:CubicO group peptidase (beta-lactamase class C family)